MTKKIYVHPTLKKERQSRLDKLKEIKYELYEISGSNRKNSIDACNYLLLDNLVGAYRDGVPREIIYKVLDDLKTKIDPLLDVYDKQ